MVELTHHSLEGLRRLTLPPGTAHPATSPSLGSPAGAASARENALLLNGSLAFNRLVPGNPPDSVLSPEDVFDAHYFRQVYGGSSGQDEPSPTFIDRARDRLLAGR